MEDEDDSTLTVPLSQLLPLPQGSTYRNTNDNFEYSLMWEADGCYNTNCHGQLYQILMDQEGDLFIVDADQFLTEFKLVPLEEHPQQSLF